MNFYKRYISLIIIVLFAVSCTNNNKSNSKIDIAGAELTINKEDKELKVENDTDKGLKEVEEINSPELKNILPLKNNKTFASNDGNAKIGTDTNIRVDGPSDNIFRIELDNLYSNCKAILEYDLYGLEDFTSVSKSINDQRSFGGLQIKTNNKWTHQKEEINTEDLIKGVNIIRFASFQDIEYTYRIKNVEIKLIPIQDNSDKRTIVVNQPNNTYYFENKGYVSGYVKGANYQKAKVYSNNNELRLENGSFEGFIELKPTDSLAKTSEVKAIFPDGEEICVTLNFDKPNLYDYLLEADNEITINSKEFSVNDKIDFELGKFLLQGAANSLNRNTEIKAFTLRKIDMPAMGPGITNVTGEKQSGIRMLPHGTQFTKAVKISLPYDTNALPQGYSAQDIRTFYFNEETRRWAQLPIDTVNEELCIVTSYTTHFTDFINGILKVPEAPQTNGFTPTQLSGLQAANPAQGINMMSPPKANNSGNASMGLPIRIPKGRNGMQPNLSFNYSSDNGNGWLGVGWDLNLPSINVETRWGVPRYDGTKETEDYLLNGKQLLYGDSQGKFSEDNLVHKKKLTNRINDREYRARVEGDFNKIKRYGDNPKGYYWIVTDRNGTKYYYGKYSAGNGVNQNCVLTDGNGNIASWKLAEVRDLSGNYIRYEYNKINSNGYSGSTNAGWTLYPRLITYTGHGTTDGKYSVEFLLDNGNRDDVIINAKKGFKEVIDRRLQKIKVMYDNHFVRDYTVIYEQGSFNKSLVCAINEVVDSNIYYNQSQDITCELAKANNIKGCYSHSFYYHKEDELVFSSKKAIATSHSGDNIYTGKNITDNHSYGGTIAFGLGKPTDKSNSIGGNIGGGNTYSKSEFAFMDINSDGLPDIIEKDGSQVSYRPLKYNGGNLVFGPETNISGLDHLTRSKSTVLNYGGELQITKFNGGYSRSRSKNTTFGYFTDLNSDGFIDYVLQGKEFYNTPNSNGEPEFNRVTSDTIFFAGDPCNYIIRDETTDPSSYTAEDTLMSNRDAVKFYSVPGDYEAGDDYLLYAPIKLRKNKLKTSYSNVDGIRYSIQVNNTILISDTIAIDDTLLHNDSVYQLGFLNKNDRIYFRLQSKNNRLFDYVEWDPTINHLDQGECPDNDIDANGLKPYTRKSSEDFLVSNNTPFIAPFQGDINLSGSISSPAQSDTIEFALIKNGSKTKINTFVDNQQFNYYIDTNLSVLEGDEIILEAYSSTSIDLASIQNNLKLKYFDSDSIIIDTTSNYNIIETKPMLHFNYYQQVEYDRIVEFTDTNLVNDVLSGNHIVNVNLINPNTNANGEFILSVKKLNDIIREKTFNVFNGVITGNDTLEVSLDSNTQLYFDFHMHDSLRKEIEYFSVYSYPNILVDSSASINVGIHTQLPDSISKFGNMYKGWGQFSYYSSNPNDPIDESELYIHDYSFDTTSINIDTSNINNIDDLQNILDSLGANSMINTPFMMMFPNMNSNYWYDMINTCKIGKGYFEHANYNMNNAINISIPGSTISDTISDGPFIKLKNGQYAKTINPFSKSINHSYSFGANFGDGNGGISASASIIFGRQESKYSFFDINGDRYPDIVGNEIQYTRPYGAFEPNSESSNPDEFVSLTKFDGVSANGGVAGPYVIKSGKSKYELIGCMGAAVGDIWNKAEYSFIDINGDGLADRVKDNGNNELQVYLNEGYRFTNQGIVYNSNIVNYGTSLSESVSGGTYPNTEFNKSLYSWSGGISSSLSQVPTIIDWTDINGDGLTDYLFKNNGKIYVKINNGSSLNSSVSLYSENRVSFVSSLNTGGQLAGSLGVPVGVCKLVGNLRYGYTQLSTKEKFILKDVNNDGYPDIVESDGDANIEVRYSKLGKINILKTVHTPLASEYYIDYELIKSSQDMPSRKYVMSSLKVDDGTEINNGTDTIQYAFEYKNPYYNRAERSFFGFDTVITNQINNSSQSKYTYRTTTEAYHNRDLLFKGLKNYDLINDSLGNKYIETKYTYRKKEIETGAIVPDSMQECFGPYYPAISIIDKYFYEGHQDYQIHTKQEFIHGKYANVTEFIDYRDTAISEDNISSFIAYKTDTNRNILSLPKLVIIKQDTTVYRKRTARYDMTIAKADSIISYNNSTAAITQLEYNNYGMLSKITYPENENSEKMYYTYTYDNSVNTYVTQVTDALGYSGSTTYDYKYGAPLTVTDISGNQMEYTYYDDGRPKTIRGPYEIQNNIPWLIKYEYFNNRKVDVNGYVPWSKTIHYDPINNGNYFNTYVFVDGLGRTVQTKKNITYTNSQGQDVEARLVSGQVEYDAYNRPVSSYKPITEALSACDTCYNTNYDNIQPTIVKYDVLDRKLQTTLPNNDINSVTYGFGNDAFGKLGFKTSITDANGITINSYTSAIGKQTTMQAPHQAVTKFKYNPLGELIQSIDPEGNQTDYEYDDFGRLLSRDHPDAGTTEYEYDNSGNVLSIKTQNLLNSSQQIDYNYHYNRIDSIIYPNNPENNVYYKYGNPGSGNEANKIELMMDASGVTLFEYGKLGELTQQTKTNIMPLGDPYTFQINWEYDSWNRTKSITYPDGEIVTFNYNNDGKPKGMEGIKDNDVYEYVIDIEYNKFGQRTELTYGNDSRSEYTYEPYLNRMTNLKTWDGNSNKILDLDYTYDDVGNIEEIENTANSVSGLGGNYTYSYNYDSLYRLVNSTGNFTDNNSINYPIELAMSYTPSGNINSKNLTTKTLIGGLTNNVNYRRSYNYNSSQAHTLDYTEVNKVKTYYSWDNNGNMTRVTDNKQYTRNLCWDEENRLATVKDNNYLSSYIYNAGGERTWKFTGEVERMTINGEDYFDAVNMNNKTLYQSPYMVVTNEQYTKHYYMGSQRVTSRIGGGMQNNPVDPLNEHIDPSPFNKDLSNTAEELYTMINRSFECARQDPGNVEFDPEFPVIENAVSENQEENDIYYYHTDHLGSSSWITYTDGSVTQHMQNLPFGEPFIDQRATSYDIRYKFTGKEMDSETGYQYFGARYYDSDLSVWLSVDPLSSSAPNWSPYNAMWNNPIMNVDPDGKWSWKFIAKMHRKRAIKKLGKEMVSPLRKIDGEWGFHIRELPQETESVINPNYDKSKDLGNIQNLTQVDVTAYYGAFVSNNTLAKAYFGLWDIMKGNHKMKGKSRKATRFERWLSENIDQSELERIYQILAGSNDDEGIDHTVTIDDFYSYSNFISTPVILRDDYVISVNGKKCKPGDTILYIETRKEDSIKHINNTRHGMYIKYLEKSKKENNE